MFSWPFDFFKGLPVDATPLCSTLSSTLGLASLKLPFPGDCGVLMTLSGRSSLGLSRTGVFNLSALSNASGSSLAPGGTVRLLGLP